jgi:hypothetical protein
MGNEWGVGTLLFEDVSSLLGQLYPFPLWRDINRGRGMVRVKKEPGGLR